MVAQHGTRQLFSLFSFLFWYSGLLASSVSRHLRRSSRQRYASVFEKYFVQKRGDAHVPTASMLLPTRDSRALLIKWIVGLLVPVMVFTFVWSGEAIINNVLLGLINPGSTRLQGPVLIEAAIFIVVFYATVIAFTGYLVAADSGRRRTIDLWIDIVVFTLVPLFLVINFGLVVGLALCAIIWPAYFFVRRRVRQARHYTPPPPLKNLEVSDAEQRAILMSRATTAGFWFAFAFAVVWLIVDLIYFFVGQLPTVLLIWVVIRTILLPIAGYFLGRLGGAVALRRTLAAKSNGSKSDGNVATNGDGRRVSKKRQLESLSTTRAREEAKDLVPNDLPLRSTGAQRFYLILIVAFVLFYPVLDPFLFGSGTAGRLAGYGDAGYYVILALGLNIVVGFAGLLDLGYVAFFAIGSYAWGIVGSTQLGFISPIHIPFNALSGLFWPMLLVTALIAAGWGVLLGAPTLRLRGDYLAIVTL